VYSNTVARNKVQNYTFLLEKIKEKQRKTTRNISKLFVRHKKSARILIIFLYRPIRYFLILYKNICKIQGHNMNIERIVLLVAGTMVLGSAILSVYHTPEWIYLTGFVGANLVFSGITGFCPMVKILRKFGLKHGLAFTK
jgi:hypothetical protein